MILSKIRLLLLIILTVFIIYACASKRNPEAPLIFPPTATVTLTATFTATVTETAVCNNYWPAPVNLGSDINTGSDEYNPIVVDQTIIFASNRPGGYGGFDIWFTERSCGIDCYWQAPQNMGPQFNTGADESGPFAVLDYTLYWDIVIRAMYFNRVDIYGYGNVIQYIERDQYGSWQIASAVQGDVNIGTNSRYASITMTSDTTGTMYYCRSNSIYDLNTNIYRAEYNGWAWINSQPVAELNTQYREDCPYYYVDISGNEFLYFVSDRPGGFGGTDIWVSKKSGSTWQEPENVCSVNTVYNEYRPTASRSNLGYERLIFSSDRPGGCGGYDLYWSEK